MQRFIYVLVQLKTENTGVIGDLPLETERTSSKSSEEISHEEIEFKEKDLEANDPIREDVIDTNKTSLELSITQVKVKHT